jgi:hypothetical protein
LGIPTIVEGKFYGLRAFFFCCETAGKLVLESAIESLLGSRHRYRVQEN